MKEREVMHMGIDFESSGFNMFGNLIKDRIRQQDTLTGGMEPTGVLIIDKIMNGGLETATKLIIPRIRFTDNI